MFSLAIFGGNRVDGRMLHPGESVFALALFGGIEFDFASTPPPPDVELTIVAVFGGSTVKVLPDERVMLSGLSLFGGRHLEPAREGSTASRRPDHEPSDDDEERWPLEINAYALFGGVEVKRVLP